MKTLAISLFCMLPLISFSQYNIKPDDMHFKRSITRSLNLNSEHNRDLFGMSNDLVVILLEAFEKNSIAGYNPGQVSEKMSFLDFTGKITYINDSISETYHYSKLYRLEISENIIVDKNRSEIVFDMEYLTIFIPSEVNRRQILEPVVSFKYDDCANIFRKDERAFAINPLSNGRSINFSELFLLRLFESYISKIGDGNYFDQTYQDSIQAFLATKRSENELTEYLYTLFNPK